MGNWGNNTTWEGVETVPYRYGVYYANSPKRFVGRERAEREREQGEYNRRLNTRDQEKYNKTTERIPGYAVMTPEARRAAEYADAADRIPGYGVMTSEARKAAEQKTSTAQTQEAKKDTKQTSSKTNTTQGSALSTTAKRTTRRSSNRTSRQQPSATQLSATSKSATNGLGFTLTKAKIPDTVTLPAPLQQPQTHLEDWGTYIDLPIVDNEHTRINYDTNYIRGFRGQEKYGYRDVNSYLTWLGNNKDSEDYKLFMLNGYFNDSGNDLDYGLIGTMLASQGIRGNLGRRDSRRLGNVLTRLRDLSTAGTEANKEFLQGVVSSYNLNKDNWAKPAEGYTGPRNAIITKDGDIEFVDDSGNETFSPFSKLSPTLLSNGNSPDFLTTRNWYYATNPSGGFYPVSLGNWLGSTGSILGSTYRPQLMTNPFRTSSPRTSFFGTSIRYLPDDIMNAWENYMTSLGFRPHTRLNSGVNI